MEATPTARANQWFFGGEQAGKALRGKIGGMNGGEYMGIPDEGMIEEDLNIQDVRLEVHSSKYSNLCYGWNGLCLVFCLVYLLIFFLSPIM